MEGIRGYENKFVGYGSKSRGYSRIRKRGVEIDIWKRDFREIVKWF